MKPDYYLQCSAAGKGILKLSPKFREFLKVCELEKYYELECFEFIDRFQFNFYLGNAFKYLWRLGAKSDDYLSDLKKSRYYFYCALDRELVNDYPWVSEVIDTINIIIILLEVKE